MGQKLGHDICEEPPELLVHICARQAAVQDACGAVARAAVRRLPGLHEMVQAVAQDVQQCLACRIEDLRQPYLTPVKGLSSRMPLGRPLASSADDTAGYSGCCT